VSTASEAADDHVRVNAFSFVRAESDTYFDSLLATAGGLGRWHHIREPAPVDKQLVVRMNRDTLYSSVIIDVGEGAELTMPETGGRYQTAIVVDQDHHIDKVFDRPGPHRLDPEEFGTPWVAVAVRTLVDPADPGDLMTVAALQDRLVVTAGSAKAFTHPAWDAQTWRAPASRCWNPPAGSLASEARSGPGSRLIRSRTCWEQQRDGAASPTTRRSTLASSPAYPPSITA
jgi:hypothetical protein